MSTDPAPSVTRGDITLQPSYFTSSLFVNPLREDIARLVQAYVEEYLGHFGGNNTANAVGSESTSNAASQGAQMQEQAAEGTIANAEHLGEDAILASTAAPNESIADGSPLQEGIGLSSASSERVQEPQATPSVAVHPQPFALFKQLWNSQGWCWFHFKVFDGRARESFLNVVLRLFSEYFDNDVDPIAKVVALFGLYTFFSTQPHNEASSSSTPLPGPSLHRVKHIALSHDTYIQLLNLSTQMTTPQLFPLSPYVNYLLSVLLKQNAFHIYPHSSLKTRFTLPREWFVEETEASVLSEAPGDGLQKVPKKKGRPGKKDKSKKARDALVQLDKWLDKSTYTYPEHPAVGEDPESSSSGPVTVGNGSGKRSARRTTHTLMSHPPSASLAIYGMQKMEYLNAVNPETSGRQVMFSPETPLVETSMSTCDQGNAGRAREKEALRRANEAVLMRLKKIDEMAAEQGLEVGGEGGEMTGLGRVQRAVNEMRQGRGSGRRGGILNLLEGAGMDSPIEERHNPDATMDVG